LLFPPRCAGCGKNGFRFCPDCIKKAPRANQQKCVFCGEYLPNSQINHQCTRQSFIDRGYVWGLHSGPLKKGLHRFKYQRDLGLADIFSELLIDVFLTTTLDLDMIVPVPLGTKRLRERGYNQAYLLADACAKRLGVDCKPRVLRRIRETRTQVGLSIVQRQQNVSGAFKAESNEVSAKRVLLIDDILTTGATLNACAEALKQAGAEHVFSLTLARAP